VNKSIVVLGSTGNLGGQIIDHLLAQNVHVKAVVRKSTSKEKVEKLVNKGVKVTHIDFDDVISLKNAFIGADCVVSALAGLRDIIYDLQKKIVEAAVEAGVPRFIPSDFCTDFLPLTPGCNRNLDMRREFHDYINSQNIRATSIFNGAFLELITGDMPLILYGQKRILCWGDPQTKMDLTHTSNVALYTSYAALDEMSPRYLHIAGQTISPVEVVDLLTKLSNTKFKLLRPGGITLFNTLIKITKFFAAQPSELYPPWQGMQYMRDMMEGKSSREEHDNERYPVINWINFEQYLKKEKYAQN
jgi:hypothetical protein